MTSSARPPFFIRSLFPFCLALCVFGAPVLAQEEDDSIFDFPTFPGEGEDESDAPEMEEQPMIDRIVFRDDSLDQVLTFLERLTGRAIIRPQALPATSITFNSQQPHTVSEAVDILLSLLSINGITVVTMGDDFLMVVPAQQSQQYGPELMLDSAMDENVSGRVASRIYQLEFLQLDEILPLITPFLDPQLGSVVPIEKANSMLVTASVRNLQRIEAILEAVDRPIGGKLETRFYSIRYASAQELAARMNNIRQNVLQREISTRTMIEPDERTNQIILITDPRNVEIFDRFVERMDVQTAPRTRNEVIQLRHAQAVDVASLLAQLVSQQLGQAAADRVQLAPERNGRPEPEAPPEPQPNGDPPAEREPALPDIQAIAEDILEETGSDFSSLLTILADERTNSLLVSGTATDIDLIEALVAKIDMVLAQVRIEVLIVEVTLSKDRGRGIDAFGFEYTRNEIGRDSGAIDFGGRGFSFGAAGTLRDFTIEGVLGIAESKSEIEVRSAPTIVTTHNQEARISVGEQRPVISQAVTEGQITGLRSTVDFREIAIVLEVLPLIGPDGIIQLEINQTVDNVIDQVQIGGNPQPVIGTKQANSFVSVANGEMVVLGGLQSEEMLETRRRMAILGYIPLLGRLFSPTSHETRKTELLLFIRPTVLAKIGDGDLDARGMIDRMSQPEKFREFIERTELDPPSTRDERLAPAQRSQRIH